jgi:hypothetical protein
MVRPRPTSFILQPQTFVMVRTASSALRLRGAQTSKDLNETPNINQTTHQLTPHGLEASGQVSLGPCCLGQCHRRMLSPERPIRYCVPVPLPRASKPGRMRSSAIGL